MAVNLRRNKRLDACSITSWAVTSSEFGTVRPSAFAVLRLITSSSLVGNSTGRSPGRAPLRIVSVKTARRRALAARLTP